MPRTTLALLLAGLFGLAAQYLFYREWLGLNFVAAVLLLLAAAWSIRRAPLARSDLWMPIFAVAFAAFVAVRTEGDVIAFDVLAALTLALATTASLRGIRVTHLPAVRLVREAWDTATGGLWRAAPLLRAGATDLGPGRGRQVVPYVGGLLLALPFLIVFIGLFASADPIFDRRWDELVGDWSLGEAIDRTIYAAIAAWLAAGLLVFRARPATSSSSSVRGPLSVEAATSFLAAIVLLFAAFVAIQVAYLFGGRDTLEAADLSHAEYARRGFFELLLVAGIVGGTLFALDLMLTRRSRAYVFGGVALVLLTGVILASAMYRLALYQQTYGWSELRLYALAVLVTVAAALVLIAWSILKDRMASVVQPIVLVACGVALLVNAVGPAGFIVRANVARLSDLTAPVAPEDEPWSRGFDHWYLVGLGDGAVPHLAEIRPRLAETPRFCLDAVLFWHYAHRDLTVEPSWQSWNLDRERARAVLAELDAQVFSKIGDPASHIDQRPMRERFHVECMLIRGL